MDKASARLGVMDNSKIGSSKARYSITEVPIGASSGKSIMPSANSLATTESEKPISCKEHSIPLDTSPLSFEDLILKPPGNSAPTKATMTLAP